MATRTELAQFIGGAIRWSKTEEGFEFWARVCTYLDPNAVGGFIRTDAKEPEEIRAKLLVFHGMLREYLYQNHDPLLREVAIYIDLKYGEVPE